MAIGRVQFSHEVELFPPVPYSERSSCKRLLDPGLSGLRRREHIV